MGSRIMIVDLDRVRIFVRPGFTDMRKQINGLSMLVKEKWGIDPLEGSLFLFAGKDRKRLKILYWDRNGFCLWLKRLERDKFPWPRDEAMVRELRSDQLSWLLKGIDFWNAHEEIFFENVG